MPDADEVQKQATTRSFNLDTKSKLNARIIASSGARAKRTAKYLSDTAKGV
jgi:hypothetical protein